MTEQDEAQPQTSQPAGQATETREAIAGSGFLAKGAKDALHLPPLDQGIFAATEPSVPDPGPGPQQATPQGQSSAPAEGND